MITAAHSFTRMTRQSLPSKRMTSPAWSRNGCCQGCQMMPTNSVCAGSLKHFLVCFIKPPSSGSGGYEHSWDYPFLPSNPPKRVSLRLGGCGCERGRRFTADRGLGEGKWRSGKTGKEEKNPHKKKE